MYEKHYNFKENPFNLTPDSRYFYPSEKHQETLDNLIYAINERKGFVVITGEIGSGKTTVCRTLLNRLDSRIKASLILNTHLTSKELIAAILEDLGEEPKKGTKAKLLNQLNRFLLEELSHDNNIVLLIDEAQNLSSRVLEEIRMLSNLETEREKLIQIILVGQPELRDKLRHRSMEQFKQRIALQYHLAPLTEEETGEYIKHRISRASTNGCEIFTPEALDKIYDYSKGIPRLINSLCDRALLNGFIANKDKVDVDIIEESIKEKEI
ncbi:MAG: AAA family ATPase [Candidatus Omnitrophica bacterium]|nr:AAA family ATPase [Candidatus Omnitrophota bacterium]